MPTVAGIPCTLLLALSTVSRFRQRSASQQSPGRAGDWRPALVIHPPPLLGSPSGATLWPRSGWQSIALDLLPHALSPPPPLPSLSLGSSVPFKVCPLMGPDPSYILTSVSVLLVLLLDRGLLILRASDPDALWTQGKYPKTSSAVKMNYWGHTSFPIIPERISPLPGLEVRSGIERRLRDLLVSVFQLCAKNTRCSEEEEYKR